MVMLLEHCAVQVTELRVEMRVGVRALHALTAGKDGAGFAVNRLEAVSFESPAWK